MYACTSSKTFGKIAKVSSCLRNWDSRYTVLFHSFMDSCYLPWTFSYGLCAIEIWRILWSSIKFHLPYSYTIYGISGHVIDIHTYMYNYTYTQSCCECLLKCIHVHVCTFGILLVYLHVYTCMYCGPHIFLPIAFNSNWFRVHKLWAKLIGRC